MSVSDAAGHAGTQSIARAWAGCVQRIGSQAFPEIESNHVLHIGCIVQQVCNATKR